jgi:mono/diheme cytochrome c family protein
LGAELYKQHCAACHGEQGQGVAGIYPTLLGSRVVTMESASNLLQIILRGGFAPATADKPRPFGMPPFASELNERELAAIASFLRSSWGHQAGEVSEVDVKRLR